MTDDKAVRGAGETAIGNERHLACKSLACNRGGRRQHLAHAGPAFRPFVTDDDHIAFLDLAVVDGFERSLFALKDARGSFKGAVGVTGGFQDRAFRREIAVKNSEAACFFERISDGMHDLLARRFLRCFEFVEERLARYCRRIGDLAAFHQLLAEEAHAARRVKIFRQILTAGFQIGDHRR